MIKICGLRTTDHVDCAIAAGADMLGLNFAPSRRRIEPAQAAALVTDLRARHTRLPQIVGLFVNEQPAYIAAIVEQCALDVIQLSGDEPVSLLDALPARPVLKAVRLAGDAHEQGWLDMLDARVTLLVDAHQPGSYGGTGMVADWAKAADLARTRPIMLAGGLRPETVAAAIQQVRPWGVDVSSGVERDGQKDCALIERFIAAARAAEQG